MKSSNKNLEKSVNKLEQIVKNLELDITVIKTHLISETGLDSGLFAKNSPLSLTEKGEKLLDETEFREVYKENKNWFLDEIKKHGVKTMADIDEAAFKVLEDCRDNEKFIDYKEIAFEHGITVELLLKTLSIYLRDEASKDLL